MGDAVRAQVRSHAEQQTRSPTTSTTSSIAKGDAIEQVLHINQLLFQQTLSLQKNQTSMAHAPTEIQSKYKDCIMRISSNLSFLASCADKTKVTPAMPTIVTPPKDIESLHQPYEQLAIAIKVHAAALSARQKTQSPLSASAKPPLNNGVQRVSQSPRTSMMSPPVVAGAPLHQRQQGSQMPMKQAPRNMVPQQQSAPAVIASTSQMASFPQHIQANANNLVQNSNRMSPQYMQQLNSAAQYSNAQTTMSSRIPQQLSVNTAISPNDMYRSASPQLNPSSASTSQSVQAQYQLPNQRTMPMSKMQANYALPTQQMPQHMSMSQQQVPRGYPMTPESMYMMGMQNSQLQVQAQAQARYQQQQQQEQQQQLQMQQLQQAQYQMPQQQQQQNAQMAYQAQLQQRMQQYPGTYDYNAYATGGL